MTCGQRVGLPKSPSVCILTVQLFKFLIKKTVAGWLIEGLDGLIFNNFNSLIIYLIYIQV